MPNPYFQFKQFRIEQTANAMKVATDSCLFGAWMAQEMQQDLFHSKGGRTRVLDIGTGTGLLSLMIAQKNYVLTDAVEIDGAGAAEAEVNIAASPWAPSISVYNDDIRSFKTGAMYDVVCSNPPFYENELSSPSGQKNLAHHSSHLLLSELLTIIKKHLHPEGYFFLLQPQKREKEVLELLTHHQLHVQSLVFVRQTSGHTPFRIMIKGRKKELANMEKSEITIRRDNGHYTHAFQELLKEYYLYL